MKFHHSAALVLGLVALAQTRSLFHNRQAECVAIGSLCTLQRIGDQVIDPCCAVGYCDVKLSPNENSAQGICRLGADRTSTRNGEDDEDEDDDDDGRDQVNRDKGGDGGDGDDNNDNDDNDDDS
jgi:hypothetical protein